MAVPVFRFSCLLIVVVTAHSEFIEKIQCGDNEEYFTFKGVTFGIFLEPVTFTEARVICDSRDGGLLEFTDEEVGLFIGHALSESAVGLSSLWIGGTYSPANVSGKREWRWLSGEAIPIPSAVGGSFPQEKLPYWAVRPNLSITSDLCLAADRKNHYRPMIFALQCTLVRPFICTLPDDKSSSPYEVSPSFTSGGKTFHLFQAYTTWAEALIFCLDMGYRLAVVKTKQEVKMLQNIMDRARPILATAWLGGKRIDGEWLWVSESRSISGINITNGSSNEPQSFDSCLLADHKISDSFAYVEADCDRKSDLVCEEDSDSVEIQTGLIRVPQTNIWISTMAMTWQDANDYCLKCLGGSLMSLQAYELRDMPNHMRSWHKAMTEATYSEITSVWLDGYLATNDKFVWSFSRASLNDTPQRETTSVVLTIEEGHWNGGGADGEEFRITFCPGDIADDPGLREYRCLNMDRDNQYRFSMYGLSCEYRQHFFCMEYPSYDGFSRKLPDKAAEHLKDTCKNKEIPWPG